MKYNENRSSNGNIVPNKAEIAWKISPLVGMNIMLNSDDGVSVTTVNSIKVISTHDDPLLLVLYTGMGLVTIDSNQKMKEILVINSSCSKMTLFSLISDIVYF